MLFALKLTVTAVAVALGLGFVALPGIGRDGRNVAAPGFGRADLITLPPGVLHYRPAGEFSRDGSPVDALAETRHMRRPLHIMRRQVTEAEYARCVGDGACPLIGQVGAPSPHRPVVKVSWRDAAAYAAWLSRKTGHHFRLPTDAEWAFAAGSRFRDEALTETDSQDPSKRWLARYDMEASDGVRSVKAVQPAGAFGANEKGVEDIAGNVWEWTDTCYERVRLDAGGARLGHSTLNCGVRVAAGRHRAYITDFVRDARNGGCALGLPPSNLGFRLVRDDAVWSVWALLDQVRSARLNR